MKHSSYIIDINADVGEGMGNDADIMPHITSCSIACGGHTGDEQSMEKTIRLALKHNVHVGPHPSFPDRDNFGRTVITMTKAELMESVCHQVLRFYTLCDKLAVPVHHVKLHGALYNYAAKDAPTADAIVEAIIASKRRPLLYVPYNSVLHRKAENLLPLAFEAFIDRRYNDDGSLVSRANKKAVIDHPQEAWEQLKNMVINQSVVTSSGKKIPIIANTFCIHGDHASAVNILKTIHKQLATHQIKLIQ